MTGAHDDLVTAGVSLRELLEYEPEIRRAKIECKADLRRAREASEMIREMVGG